MVGQGDRGRVVGRAVFLVGARRAGPHGERVSQLVPERGGDVLVDRRVDRRLGREREVHARAAVVVDLEALGGDARARGHVPGETNAALGRDRRGEDAEGRGAREARRVRADRREGERDRAELRAAAREGGLAGIGVVGAFAESRIRAFQDGRGVREVRRAGRRVNAHAVAEDRHRGGLRRVLVADFDLRGVQRDRPRSDAAVEVGDHGVARAVVLGRHVELARAELFAAAREDRFAVVAVARARQQAQVIGRERGRIAGRVEWDSVAGEHDFLRARRKLEGQSRRRRRERTARQAAVEVRQVRLVLRTRLDVKVFRAELAHVAGVKRFAGVLVGRAGGERGVDVFRHAAVRGGPEGRAVAAKRDLRRARRPFEADLGREGLRLGGGFADLGVGDGVALRDVHAEFGRTEERAFGEGRFAVVAVGAAGGQSRVGRLEGARLGRREEGNAVAVDRDFVGLRGEFELDEGRARRGRRARETALEGFAHLRRQESFDLDAGTQQERADDAGGDTVEEGSREGFLFHP